MTLPHPHSTTLDVLPRADGSARHTQNGYTVLGAVNAPIEVQRRDELAEEAAIEVHVRPAVGVGATGVRERHLETLIHSTLRAVLLVQQFPRTLVQVTLQMAGAPPDTGSATSHSSHYVSVRSPSPPQPFSPTTPHHTPPQPTAQAANILLQSPPQQPLPLLPALLQTALLSLLSASIPLSTTYSSVLLAVPRTRTPSRPSTSPIAFADPSPSQLRDAASVHVLTFSARGEMLVVESEGEFDVGVWERVVAEGERICRGSGGGEDGDVEMDVEEGQGMGMEKGLREVVRGKVERDGRWREEVR